MVLCSPNKKSCLSNNLWFTGTDILASLGPLFRYNIEVIDVMKLKLFNRTA